MNQPYLFPLDRAESEYIEREIGKLSDRAHFQTSLERLLQRWQTFVEQVEVGYADSIYEYTNDLSVRDLLEGIGASAPASLRERLAAFLKEWDDRFSAATEETDRAVAPGAPPSGAARWRRIPRRLLSELKEDLRNEGVI